MNDDRVDNSGDYGPPDLCIRVFYPITAAGKPTAPAEAAAAGPAIIKKFIQQDSLLSEITSGPANSLPTAF
jgi:hypothetical protein